MLVRKKKAISEDSSSVDNLQSLRSWIRKIEQTTTSVSSRLSAVESRLSGGAKDTEGVHHIAMEGPIEKLFLDRKKRNANELARALDSELTLLYNELVKQEQQLSGLKEQLVGFEERNGTMGQELQTIHTSLSQMNASIESKMRQTERQEPFMMRLGAMQIPLEITGIIGGLLAFTIAILVVFNQKAVLLSPVFLFCVGVLLIGSAVLKMVRTRSRSELHPCSSMPLQKHPADRIPVPYQQEDG